MAWTYQERLDALRAAKLAQTQEKQRIIGSMNHDDWALVLPPEDAREVIETMSTSGMPITDVLLKGFVPQSNHPSGGFFGPRACGANYRRLLECHPTFVDPNSSLAGAYMVNFSSYRKPVWNPDFDYSYLHDVQARYKLGSGIGATQHFCHDLAIGLALGWDGLLNKVRQYRQANAPAGADFYAGLEDVVLGMQNWIARNAEAARHAAAQEPLPERRKNLQEMAAINVRLAHEPPRTFREACQWMVWYQMAARMYNGSGALGRMDVLLTPFYLQDTQAGLLTDEEAIFHVACFLLRNTDYLQLGGPDADGVDQTNHVSYLILEAAHQLGIPANVGVCVGEHVDPGLVRRGVEILFEDRTGIPKFLGIERTAEGFARNGYPLQLGRERAYSGCHWSAIPGREYTMNDCVKINLGVVFEVAWQDLVAEAVERRAQPGVASLWERFGAHLRQAVAGIAEGLDFHLEHMHQVFPELVLDLLCYGPIEKGQDASHGGVEFTNLCVDAAALATVADSFAALEQRVEREGFLRWEEIVRRIANDWAGPEGERARLMMRGIPRYGTGGAPADVWAERVAGLFTDLVKERPTPQGHPMIPGIFSWANTIPMGKELGATPNGRKAGAPISHGANPDPGFRQDGAPSAMAVAIASVQPGYGNTAPMQLEVDPALSRDQGGVEHIAQLIETHFRLGGTQINLNVMDAEQVLEAHQDPTKYPNLVVRVTGFSAYFASLSPEFRQLVVDRIITEGH
ncbi:MAG: pyruvate formate lyase family protein [Anaerolineae bacterium]